ncbi:MAG: alanine--tRNA ligase [Candidatus Thermoplasmatota archaeon]|nr:alanine--tRNA ligase [Candidatus Thermoplasmatota archaeon]
MSSETGQLDLELFNRIAFTKKKCTKCDSYFWTSDAERKTCGDPPCDSYTFIGKSPISRPYTLKEMRGLFIGFFTGDHGFLKPYPVVPRWRDDVLLVNASIYNFQPHVTSGRVKPPDNPLVMSQPSIRMTDTDLVGETGRHLTSFEMLCHDAFNYPDRFVYWKEETVEYCFKLLTEGLRIEAFRITFKEKPWSGGGNGGNAFEVFVGGLEVATLVFMDLQEDENGEFEIDGKKYSKMSMKIVDTGYGLERLVWLSQGTPTVYEAIMSYAINEIMDKSQIQPWDSRIMGVLSKISAETEPFDKSLVLDRAENELRTMGISLSAQELENFFERSRAVFVLADHTKTLMTLFADYVIPSNVKVGYLARLLIRRALRAKRDANYSGTIYDLIKLHHENMSDVIQNFPEKFIAEALKEEEARYNDLYSRAEGIVLRVFDKNSSLSSQDLVTLYDSSGITPELAKRIVHDKRKNTVTIPENFNYLVISRHEQQRQIKKNEETFPDIFTRPLYYDDTSIREFNAIVLHSEDKIVITNQTAFYPEGGGQPTDLGYFVYHGKNVDMLKAERHGNAIVHRLSSAIPEKSRIIGHIDYARRRRLMVHHSATHLLLGVLRRVLGEHVWQSGVQKGVDRSRIDITHFHRPSTEEISLIEKECLQYITQNRSITVRNIEWNGALSKYGFRLFEGGVPEGGKVRVVEIDGVDVEGCGGTHLKSTGEIGFIKIIKVETIQEGIQRFTFAAGEAALDYVHSLYNTASLIEKELSASSENVEEAFTKVIQENISMRKYHERKLKQVIENAVNNSGQIEINGNSLSFISGSFEEDEIKGIISAMFSLRRDIAILQNLSGSSVEIRIITTRLDSMQIGGCISAHVSGEVKGSSRHAWISCTKRLNETLIKEILDGCKFRGS